MQIFSGWASYIGVSRKENQDYCFTETHETATSSVCLTVVCDGMGGMDQGSFASQLVCDAYADWFHDTFTNNKRSVAFSKDATQKLLISLLEINNAELVSYGKKNNIRSGTTASVLFIYNDWYCALNVGDSRIYCLSDVTRMITEDDSVAADKLRRGEINHIEYENSKEKHKLTQCIGVNDFLNVHCYTGKCASGNVFFLCTDGMYHFLRHSELNDFLEMLRREKGNMISSNLERLIDRIIMRGEQDNISGAAVYCI